MLENYYIKPSTLDRIQDCWLGKSIDQYVSWLAENKYAQNSVQRRVPVLMHFAEYSWNHGARTTADLPALVDAFVDNWIATRRHKEVRPTFVTNQTLILIKRLICLNKKCTNLMSFLPCRR